ncbi:HAD-IA family hydrolase [Prochlorothrix hollandica]|uniref:HAD-IA family hydrolase n=1 Tax=Prochlorothrix hollandica TaxID=1223 RepID=UPI0003689E5D|nr:HAD-IA family hydrolase [Prochlorothrix hollandica]
MLLVDIDGTLTTTASGANFGQNPHDYRAIPEAAIALRQVKVAEPERFVVGITNQGGVGAGHKSFNDCVIEQRWKLRLFPELELILFCPDYGGKECWIVRRSLEPFPLHGHKSGLPWVGSFRKPEPGMLRLALDMRTDITEECLMVGDRPEDAEAARNAGVAFLSAEDWWKGGSHGHHKAA